MKRIIILFLLVCSYFAASAQTYAYVSSSSLNLRTEASTDSEVVKTLRKYDNLVVNDTLSSSWLKVFYNQTKGYVHGDFVKAGQAKVTIVQGGRIGAVCKDGTTSSATGRGACSHHGGVSYWRHLESKRVEIINNK